MWDDFFFQSRIAIRRVLQTLIGLDTFPTRLAALFTKLTRVYPMVQKFNTVMLTISSFT